MKEKENDKVIQVPVEDILPNRFQPRLAFDEKELTELSNSILKYGIIQPIVLRKIGNKYEIIAGERRYKATVMAGLKTIPAIINDADDNTSAEIALLENLQRKNLTVIEEAQSFKKLIDRGFTQEEIANKLGVSQSSIANKLRLLNLPKRVQDALLFNKISERHARSLLSITDEDTQLVLLDRIISERLTVRQTEDEINKLLNKNDNDIPEEVNKFIERKEPKVKENTHFINYIPDVVNIDEEINPFQQKFQENIKKIEESLNNKEESFLDKIIQEDLNKHKQVEEKTEEKKEQSHIEFEDPVVEAPSIPGYTGKNQSSKTSVIDIVNKARGFVDTLNDDRVVVKESDFPDVYRITIEIKKDDK